MLRVRSTVPAAAYLPDMHRTMRAAAGATPNSAPSYSCGREKATRRARVTTILPAGFQAVTVAYRPPGRGRPGIQPRPS
jgi:hypothetical protein